MIGRLGVEQNMSQVDFRAGLKKTGLAPTVPRADAGSAVPAAATSPAAPAQAKQADLTKSKDNDLEAKLAARRKWEGGGSVPPVTAKSTGGSDDLAAKLAARRKWEDGAGDQPAASSVLPAKASPSKSPAAAVLPKSAPGCVPPADDLAAKLAKRRNWEDGTDEGVSREQQAIEAAAREQQEREERAKAAADAEYKRKIADDLAKRKAQEAAEQEARDAAARAKAAAEE